MRSESNALATARRAMWYANRSTVTDRLPRTAEDGDRVWVGALSRTRSRSLACVSSGSRASSTGAQARAESELARERAYVLHATGWKRGALELADMLLVAASGGKLRR